MTRDVVVVEAEREIDRVEVFEGVRQEGQVQREKQNRKGRDAGGEA